MAMLSSHIQVHDGLVVALSELLLVADDDLSLERARGLLQPKGLGDRVPDVVELTVDVAEWLGLAVRDGNAISASPSLRKSSPSTLHLDLPSFIRRELFDQAVTSSGEAKGGDLARALVWFVAQDAWDPPRAFERVERSGEQRLHRQFGVGSDLVNSTKWLPLCRWAVFLGLGVTDAIQTSQVIPDVTGAVRSEVSNSDVELWTAREFTEFVGARCKALDGGELRESVMEHLAPTELAWEHDEAILSPSLTMALLRLEHEGELVIERKGDTVQSDRRLLNMPDSERTIDVVRTVGNGA
jgi:hypothetical protein